MLVAGKRRGLIAQRTRPLFLTSAYQFGTGRQMSSVVDQPLTNSSDATAPEPALVQYYLKQGIFEHENLSTIKQTLEAPLPACFRINPNSHAHNKIKQRLAEEFPKVFETVMHDGQRLKSPRELSWYPFKQGAWQLDCGRSALSKHARDYEQLQDFRDFLLYHTSEGNISRQEAVSMIPALLLDVQPHHRVLDLCAAPGSKTTQVMEELGQKALSSKNDNFDADSGFIVANDANEKRGYMLVHQLQRLGLETAVVTCHKGQQFPGLYVAGKLQATSVFDRIICDVPCSGDGTIRKNKNLWWQWSTGSALTLHKTQLELALRAAALLKPNGLMVYSTCSLNPIENEAVIAELLRRADGALEIVGTSNHLPGLITRNGMNAWQVAWQSKTAKRSEMEWFAEYEDVPANLRGMRILKSMFPPTPSSSMSEELHNCVRLFPTDQNTGGFFVTLLRKKRSLPGDQESGLAAYETTRLPVGKEAYICALCGETTHTIRNCKLSRRTQRLKEERALNHIEQVAEDPLHSYSRLKDEYWKHIQSFYGITDSFPQEHLFGRSDGATSVCLVNANVQEACLAGRQLKIMNTGIRVFARVPAGDKLVFRPTEEGLAFVLPFITKRKVDASLDDLNRLLSLTALNGQVHSLEIVSSALQERLVAIRDLSGVGPMVLVAAHSDYTTNPRALPVWIGDKTLVLLVDSDAQQRLANAIGQASS